MTRTVGNMQSQLKVGGVGKNVTREGGDMHLGDMQACMSGGE